MIHLCYYKQHQHDNCENLFCIRRYLKDKTKKERKKERTEKDRKLRKESAVNVVRPCLLALLDKNYIVLFSLVMI